jgi:hypothetical protein
VAGVEKDAAFNGHILKNLFPVAIGDRLNSEIDPENKFGNISIMFAVEASGIHF